MLPSLSAKPARSLAAILCADVQGYSRLMAKNEERTYERVTRAIQLVRSLIGDYGGRVVNVAGDGMVALFDSAAQALKFSVVIQQEFRDEAVWHADDEPVAFRIGINIGEILAAEGNIQGHSINIAARIQALASPGGICVTETVARAVGDTLGVQIRPLGSQHLKNMDEPIEVFAIDVNGPEPSATAARPVPSGRVFLPVDQASVAVLPFENGSGDPGDRHLCDGLTRDIIANLTRFRDLLVIAPHSAFQFRLPEWPREHIGRHLGVRYLVTGSLQRSGRRIRLRVQLAEAETDRVLWSERYDGDLGEIFTFQDDVTASTAARLAIQISAAERSRAATREPPDLRVYGLILRGQDLSLQCKREPNLFARHLFEQAAVIDPHYGRTYAGLSRTFNLAWRYRWTDDPGAALDRALELARMAIAYDHLDARGFGELGYAHLYRKQHDEALAAYERALALNPNDADILAEMADALVYSGQAERSIQLLKQAMRLNPYFPDWYLWYIADAYFHLCEYDNAIQSLRKMRDQSEAHRLLASSYALLGRMDEAREHAARLMEVHPNFSLAHWESVPPYRDRSYLEPFLDGLRKAGLK